MLPSIANPNSWPAQYISNPLPSSAEKLKYQLLWVGVSRQDHTLAVFKSTKNGSGILRCFLYYGGVKREILVKAFDHPQYKEVQGLVLDTDDGKIRLLYYPETNSWRCSLYDIPMTRRKSREMSYYVSLFEKML
jgi:hypothetical protein